MLFAKVPIGIFETPGKDGIHLLKPREPQPEEAKTVNIVVKPPDPTTFPFQARNIKKMLNDLRTLNLLDDVIGLCKKGTIRTYNREEKKLNPVKEGKGKKLRGEINVYDVVPKCYNIYVYVLPEGQYILLYHICGRWFRALAYFKNHYFYSHFLCIYFSNFRMLSRKKITL